MQCQRTTCTGWHAACCHFQALTSLWPAVRRSAGTQYPLCLTCPWHFAFKGDVKVHVLCQAQQLSDVCFEPGQALLSLVYLQADKEGEGRGTAGGIRCEASQVHASAQQVVMSEKTTGCKCRPVSLPVHSSRGGTAVGSKLPGCLVGVWHGCVYVHTWRVTAGSSVTGRIRTSGMQGCHWSASASAAAGVNPGDCGCPRPLPPSPPTLSQ